MKQRRRWFNGSSFTRFLCIYRPRVMIWGVKFGSGESASGIPSKMVADMYILMEFRWDLQWAFVVDGYTFGF